jgi:hypothetical protein
LLFLSYPCCLFTPIKPNLSPASQSDFNKIINYQQSIINHFPPPPLVLSEAQRSRRACRGVASGEAGRPKRTGKGQELTAICKSQFVLD